MTYEEIDKFAGPKVKQASVENKESKLQVKSAASDEENKNELPYWVQIEQFISGASA